jgi:hypothetical protein
LARKPEGKRQLGRPRRIWEDNNMSRMDLKKYGRKLWTGFIWLRIGTCGGLL